MTQALIEAAAEAKMADQVKAETELEKAKQNATPRKTEEPVQEGLIVACVMGSTFSLLVFLILLTSA